MRTSDVQTEDMKEGTTDPENPFEFSCFDNKYKEINGAYYPINDAHYFGSKVFEFYRNWYGLEPLDRAKVPVACMRVHYGPDYEGAFWRQGCMHFGNGEHMFYPVVSLDVTTHEMAHGFTEHNSNLLYFGPSGAINESFSDMAGETAESYSRSGQEPNFLVAWDVIKHPDRALRYMCDPTKDGISIADLKNYHEGMDVHYSSGLYNRVFCELSRKAGWNVREAFQVFLVANQNFWARDTDFITGAQGAVDATNDLNYNVNDVKDAFSSVGIRLP